MACNNSVWTINPVMSRNSLFRRSFSDNNICFDVSRNIIRNSSSSSSGTKHKLKSNQSRGNMLLEFSSSFVPGALRSLLPMDLETTKRKEIIQVEDDHEMVFESDDDYNNNRSLEAAVAESKKRFNWVEKLLELHNDWRSVEKKQNDNVDHEEDNLDLDGCGDSSPYEEGCEVSYEDDDDNEDRKTLLSNMLRHVCLSDMKLFSRLAFLCNMAYVIPQIKGKDLRRYYGLEFVTSSLVKKLKFQAAETTTSKKEAISGQDSDFTTTTSSARHQKRRVYLHGHASVAYEIAASAASYVQSRVNNKDHGASQPLHQEDHNNVKSVLHENKRHFQEEMSTTSTTSQRRLVKYNKSEKMAACVAASAVTAVVAADDLKKDEAASQLQSLHSSPCDWFVCDDSTTHTRCFIIQGSDSVASWQANLFFEPTKFEDTDVLVHRGIYEAAKGIYEQFMPEILQYLDKHGDKARLQFTGHSLGGSLSLVVNLMLLTRKVVNPNCLLPVVTFGAPFVFCGGKKVLHQLGLNDNHLHSVMMHRDIVPRAFSCNYPDHVAIVLKRLNATFRSHPCLNKDKLLYSPMGKMFILQPDEKISPPHPLLPSGSAMYTLQNSSNCSSAKKALRAFLNSPHPLETLSDLTAYGSNGTIFRDHDSSHYLKAVNEMIRKHKRPFVIRKAIEQRNLQWPLLTSQSPHAWTQE